ncbi:MAG: L-lactate permease [Brevinema sp.]
MFLLAISPIILFIVGLSVFKIPSNKIAPGILAFTSISAIIVWKHTPFLLGHAILEGTVFALWFIGVIVFAALTLSDLLERTGAAKTIQTAVSQVTRSVPATAVIVCWGLESFLECIAGFGSGMVLPILILRSIGVSPFRAALCALLGNTMPTAFGGLGSGIVITAAGSGTDANELYTALSFFLLLPSFLMPFVIARCASSSWKEVWKIFPVPLGAFIGQRIGLSIPLGIALNTLLAGIFCFGVSILAAKIFLPKEEHPSRLSFHDIIKASSPFLIAISLIIFTSRVNPIVHNFLRSFSSDIQFYPGGAVLRFNWFIDPGIPLLVSALIGGWLQGARVKEFKEAFFNVGGRITSTIIVLISIISLSKVMTYSGMIDTISQTLANNVGKSYVGLAPILGSIGSFTMGSITSAAVLMASLNREMANFIGIPAVWIVASYSAGATAFNMMSLYALSIISSILGTKKHEHELMQKLSPYALGYLGIILLSTIIGSKILL